MGLFWATTSALWLGLAVVLSALQVYVAPSTVMTSNFSAMNCRGICGVVTDLTIVFHPSTDPDANGILDPRIWHRLEKELYLHTAERSAWLHVAHADEGELTLGDLVVTNIKVGEAHPNTDSGGLWESRQGGIWIQRSEYRYIGQEQQAVTGVDVLFGIDAVDPRPQWALMQSSLHLDGQPEIPVARLTIRYGRTEPTSHTTRTPLRTKDDGKFKIVQISDTHMVTGVGVCNDAMDAQGKYLPTSEADPLTVKFLGGILDLEKPDLVVLTGDQLHHDILDSQSTLFKVIAPLVERSIPYAAVFGNHDAEGAYILSRTAQMSLYKDLPFSLCQSGPEEVDGVGNYYLQVYAPEPSEYPLSTLYFLDSHGQLPSSIRYPDYEWIKQSQIDWFTDTSQTLRKVQEKRKDSHDGPHLSLAFLHIPFPEFADDSKLIIRGGTRREPTEGPKFNSHLYTALAGEGVLAVGAGHDHVNDFCALQPQPSNVESQHDGKKSAQSGPWLCYNGASGFGGYSSYDDIRYYRRTRVWELDTKTGGIRTWKRMEYSEERVDELVLVEGGAVVTPTPDFNRGTTDKDTQAPL